MFGSGPVTITSSTLSGNQAGSGGSGTNSGAGGSGGGVWGSGTVTITNALLKNNTAGQGTGSTFAASGGGHGGAVHAPSLLYLTNSTVSGNTAGNGAKAAVSGGSGGSGGGISAPGTASIVHATITANSAGTGGGGIVPESAGSGGGIGVGARTVLFNTVVAGNPGNNCSASVINSGGNLQHPGAGCGASIPSADPLLAGLANNGGPTETHALGGGSPALDTADAFVCIAYAGGLDQRGLARPAGAGCDKGAFELGAVAPVLASGAQLDLLGWPQNAATQLAGQQHIVFSALNRGNAPLSNAVVQVSLPSGLQQRGYSLIVDGLPQANGTGGRSCRQTSTSFALCNLGTLAPGQVVTLILTAQRVGVASAPLCATGVASGGSPVQTVRATSCPRAALP